MAFEIAGVLLRNGARREIPRPQQTRSAQPFQRVTQQVQQPIRNSVSLSPQALRSDSGQALSSSSGQAIKEFPREQKKYEAPPDWLGPKIFKGSTSFE